MSRSGKSISSRSASPMRRKLSRVPAFSKSVSLKLGMVPKPASWTQSLIVVASSLEEVASLESRSPRNDLRKALVCNRRDSGGGDTSGGGGAGSSSVLSGIPTGGGGGGTSSLSMNNNLDGLPIPRLVLVRRISVSPNMFHLRKIAPIMFSKPFGIRVHRPVRRFLVGWSHRAFMSTLGCFNRLHYRYRVFSLSYNALFPRTTPVLRSRPSAPISASLSDAGPR